MEQVLGLTIRGKDQGASSALKSINQSLNAVGAVARATTAPVRAVGTGFNATAAAAATFNQRVASIAGKFHEIGQAARTMTAPVLAAGRAMQSLGASVANVGSGLGAAGVAGAVAGVGSLAAAMGSLASRGVDMNLTVDGATAAMTRISGSAQGAATFISALRKEAETSALTFKDMLSTSQSLASVYVQAYGPGGLGRVIPTMRAFADAATVLRVDPGGMQNALLGFRQLASAPKASLEDIKQVDENLPGAGVRSIVRAAFGSDEADVLEKAGKTGADVAEAIVKGLRRKFDGAQAAGALTLPVMTSNIQDVLDNLGARVSVGLKNRLTMAVKTVLDSLGSLLSSTKGQAMLDLFAKGFDRLGDAAIMAARSVTPLLEAVAPLGVQLLRSAAAVGTLVAKFAASREIVGGLLTPLRAVGMLLEKLAEGGQRTVKALEQLINVRNVTLLLSNAFGLLQTVVQSVFSTLGVGAKDLKTALELALNPVFVKAFAAQAFGFLSGMVEGGIHLFFGLGRVWNEVGRMMQSIVQDLQDAFQDFAINSVGDAFKGFGLLKAGVADFAAHAIGNILGVATALSHLVDALGKDSPISKLLGAGVKRSIDPLLDLKKQAEGQRSEGLGMVAAVDMAQPVLQMFRDRRNDDRLRDDPYRKDNAGKRITDAFNGRPGQTGAEDNFRNLFHQNRDDLYKMIFGGFEDERPINDPYAPRVPYGRAPGEGSVFTSDRTPEGYRRPAVPGMRGNQPPPQPVMGYDPNDEYRAVRLPDGSTTTAFLANAKGLPFTELNAPPAAAAPPQQPPVNPDAPQVNPNEAGGRGGGEIPLQRGPQSPGGGNTYQFNITVPPGPMTQEQFMRYMADVARRVYERKEQENYQRDFGRSPHPY